MSDEEMLAAVRAEAGPCPRCGATAAKPIFWGYPEDASHARFGGRFGWGGCVIPDSPAAYECGACGQEYGAAQFGRLNRFDDDA